MSDSIFFFLRDGVGDVRSRYGPGRMTWLLGAISPNTGATFGTRGAEGAEGAARGWSLSEAFVDLFSLLDEARREVAEVRETRERHERAANDFDPRRTCSVASSHLVSECFICTWEGIAYSG